jgi:hypothetical protein
MQTYQQTAAAGTKSTLIERLNAMYEYDRETVSEK